MVAATESTVNFQTLLVILESNAHPESYVNFRTGTKFGLKLYANSLHGESIDREAVPSSIMQIKQLGVTVQESRRTPKNQWKRGN